MWKLRLKEDNYLAKDHIKSQDHILTQCTCLQYSNFFFYCKHAQNKHMEQRKKSLSMMQMKGFVEKAKKTWIIVNPIPSPINKNQHWH